MVLKCPKSMVSSPKTLVSGGVFFRAEAVAPSRILHSLQHGLAAVRLSDADQLQGFQGVLIPQWLRGHQVASSNTVNESIYE